mmetsp:Transcript_27310/g.59651  ORF Transcript_27310/g.59651 Transcript_27310/m.59651 type:complete len:332 (-) Transcript_27310:55-1050(-)
MAQAVESTQTPSTTLPDDNTEGSKCLPQVPDASDQPVAVPPGEQPAETAQVEAAPVNAEPRKPGVCGRAGRLARKITFWVWRDPRYCLAGCICSWLVFGILASITVVVVNMYTGCSQYDKEADCLLHSGGESLCTWPENGDCGCLGDNAEKCPYVSGGSFVAGTLVQTREGWQRIEDLRLGDDVLLGGRVVARMEFMANREDIFLYQAVPRTSTAKPIVVAGTHAVFDGERWMRIRQAPGASPIDAETWESLLLPGETFLPVYDVDVERHRLFIRPPATLSSDDEDTKGILFSDFSEVDSDHPLVEGFEQSLLGALNDAAARAVNPPDLTV